MAVTAESAVTSGVYEFDRANTRIGFSARYAMVTTVRGGFGEFSGEIRLDARDPAASTVVVSVATASIDTGQAQRDDHLRSADFLDVVTYPEMRFRSTAVAATGPDRYRVDGQLTIRGVTRTLPLDFALTGTSRDAAGKELVGFEGTGKFSRDDFGLSWNAALETGGVLVGDEVTLQFDVSLVRADVVGGRSQSVAVTAPSGRRRLLRFW
jgi:polyisoprenoid-binding protein YceI